MCETKILLIRGSLLRIGRLFVRTGKRESEVNSIL